MIHWAISPNRITNHLLAEKNRGFS
jgi:hypothetical protein